MAWHSISSAEKISIGVANTFECILMTYSYNDILHHIIMSCYILSYHLTRKKSFYFITHAWYCLFFALSMKYACTQSIWGLCKSLIRGKLNVPFGGTMKIYAYSIFLVPNYKCKKVWYPTHCSKHMYIKAWKFAKGIQLHFMWDILFVDV